MGSWGNLNLAVPQCPEYSRKSKQRLIRRPTAHLMRFLSQL